MKSYLQSQLLEPEYRRHCHHDTVRSEDSMGSLVRENERRRLCIWGKSSVEWLAMVYCKFVSKVEKQQAGIQLTCNQHGTRDHKVDSSPD